MQFVLPHSVFISPDKPTIRLSSEKTAVKFSQQFSQRIAIQKSL